MKENRHAKAGNLNNAMSMTDSPWVVTLDADMIPMQNFLTEAVPYTFLPVMKKLEDGTWAKRTAGEMDGSFRIGFIQTPQSFYNPDLFQFNFFSEKRIPNEQDFFFKEVNVGRNKANAPIYAGSNTLLSRQALNEAGGFATGTVTVSASDEITEIPEQSIVYWSMWEEDEPQADVIREAAEAYEEATGISVEIQWKGRGIRSLIEPALDAGEQIDLFDDDYQRMAQEHRDYLAELKGMADTVDYEKHIMPVLLELVKNWGNGELLAMPYQPYITGVWYNKDLWEEAGLTEQDIPDTWEKLIRVCRKIKNSDSGLSAMTCDEEYVNLLYGYQLARYLGQEKVQQLIRNCTWSQIPQAKEAADDIRILFFAGYMSQSAPAQHPEGQDEVGDGEAVMVLQGSWVPNEVTEATESDDSWGFFPWPAVKAGTDGTEGVMVGAQGFGVTKDSQMKQEAFDFAYSICTGETDMKMTDAVNSIPADTDNTQWPEVLADAVPYMKEMSKPYMWAAGLEADPDYKEQIQSELLKLTRLEETSDEFIENLSNMK